MSKSPVMPVTIKAGAPPMDAATARIRDICKTLLAITLVCVAMPFLTIGRGDISHTLSLWQIATRLWRLDLIKMLPETAGGMVFTLRLMAWAVIVILAMSWLVIVTRYRQRHFTAVMIACLAALLLSLGIYFYLHYVLLAPLEGQIELIFGNGAIVIIAGALLTALALLTTKLKKRMLMAAVLILLIIPATLAFGILFLGDRKYYIVSLLIIVETTLPFFMVFEQRQPQAREMVLIAVMVAIAVIGRAAFFMLPAFKPLVAIVIIAGVALGAEAGFLVGALAGFVSNFFFGQGPWTPWQMFAFGICGFLAGVLFQRGLLSKRRVPLAIFGGLAIMLICGPLLDICSFFTMAMQQTVAMFWAIMLSGIPYNAIHATATVVFLLLLAKPMNEKLDYIKQKYGLIEPPNDCKAPVPKKCVSPRSHPIEEQMTHHPFGT